MINVATKSVFFQLGGLTHLEHGKFVSAMVPQPFSQEAFSIACDVLVGRYAHQGLKRRRSGRRSITQTDPTQFPTVQRIIDSSHYRYAIEQIEPLLHKIYGGDLNALQDLATLARHERENIVTLWDCDRPVFDRRKWGIAFVALRRAMNTIAQHARHDVEIVDAFKKFEESPKADYFLSIAYLALADLAREGTNSPAYYLLDSLAARNNMTAIVYLSDLMEYGLSKPAASQSIGAQRAKIFDERLNDKAREFGTRLCNTFTPLKPARLNKLILSLFSSPDAFAQEMDSLVSAGNVNEVYQAAMSMYRKMDQEQLEHGLSKLADAARSNVSALFALLGFYSVKDDYVSTLLNNFEEESFLALIKKYKVHVIFALHMAGPASAFAAMKSIPVDADEADMGYLERLNSHGNKSARRRLKELKESHDAEIIPLFNPDDRK